jgi:hypothetical protein
VENSVQLLLEQRRQHFLRELTDCLEKTNVLELHRVIFEKELQIETLTEEELLALLILPMEINAKQLMAAPPETAENQRRFLTNTLLICLLAVVSLISSSLFVLLLDLSMPKIILFATFFSPLQAALIFFGMSQLDQEKQTERRFHNLQHQELKQQLQRRDVQLCLEMLRNYQQAVEALRRNKDL